MIDNTWQVRSRGDSRFPEALGVHKPEAASPIRRRCLSKSVIKKSTAPMLNHFGVHLTTQNELLNCDPLIACVCLSNITRAEDY